MADAHEFLKTLAIVLGVAAITTIVFQKLRQPVVLGYIIAGLVVGPHLPLPLNADPKTVQTLSELGVILLMFAIGLELDIGKLLRVAPTAGVIAVIQVALMICAGVIVGGALGWTQLESIFAGSAIAISSTTIIAKVFDETNIASQLREIVYGILIVEDIIAILLLATMATVSNGSGIDAATLAITTGKLVAFLVAMVVVGLVLVPRVMRLVVKIGRPETTVVASIGICFVFAHACAAMHYSVALGAFVAGMLIAESGEGHTVEHHILPVRDMFAAIFFVSVGMLIDPRLVIENWLAVLVLSAIVVVGKIIGVTLGGIVTGCGLRTSVQAGLSLSQIGEFSFIIVTLGSTLGATRPFLFPVAVAVSALTTLTTPSLIVRSERAATFVESHFPRRITAFVALYSAWLERVRSAPTSTTRAARLRRLGILLVVDALLIVGLLIGGAVLHERAAAAAATRFGLSDRASEGVFAAVAALVGLPLVFGVVRLTRAIGLTIAGVDEKVARPIALVVQLGLLSAVAATAITAVEPFVPPGVAALLLFALVVVAVVAFVRSARQFEVEVKAGGAAFMNVFKKLSARGDQPAAHAAPSNEKATDILQGLGAPSMFRLERGSGALNASLAELDLRAKTGAVVLAIVRNGSVMMMPDPNERLTEGDTVAVVGPEDALSRMASLLA